MTGLDLPGKQGGQKGKSDKTKSKLADNLRSVLGSVMQQQAPVHPPQYPHETEALVRSMKDQLQAHARQQDAQMAMHLQAQGQLDELGQQQAQLEQEQQFQDRLQKLQMQMGFSDLRMPDVGAQIQEEMHSLGPNLDPEVYQGLQDRFDFMRRIPELEHEIRQGTLGAISGELQGISEEGTVPRYLKGVMHGATLGDNTSSSRILRAARDKAAKLSGQYYGDYGGPATKEALGRTPPKGLSQEAYDQMAAQIQSQVLAELEGSFPKEMGREDFEARAGQIVGMLLPFGTAGKAGKLAGEGVKKLLPGSLGHLAGFVTRQAVPVAIGTAVGMTMPVDEQQQFHLDQLDPDQRAKAEEAYRLMNGLHLGPLMLLYHAAGGVGQMTSRALGGGALGGAAGGLSMGALFPGLGEGADLLAEQLAKGIGQEVMGMDFATLADFYLARREQGLAGPVEQMLGAARSADWEKLWEATQEYASEAAPGMVVFSALGVFGAMGGKFKDRASAEKALEKALKEVDKAELDPAQKEVLKREITTKTEELSPTAEQQQAMDTKAALEKKVGSREKADQAVMSQVLAQRVKRPEGVEAKGEGLKERRQELQERLERLQEEEGPRQEILALEAESRALEHMEKGLGLQGMEQLRESQRAERLLDYAEKTRAGEKVEYPGFGETQEGIQAAVQGKVRSELQLEEQGPKIGKQILEAKPKPKPQEPKPTADARPVQAPIKEETAGPTGRRVLGEMDRAEQERHEYLQGVARRQAEKGDGERGALNVELLSDVFNLGIEKVKELMVGSRKKFVRRIERVAGTTQHGVRKKASWLDSFRFGAGTEGEISVSLTKSLSVAEQVRAEGNAVYRQLNKVFKEGSDAERALYKLMRTRAKETRGKAWKDATPEQREAAEKLGQFFDRMAPTSAERTTASLAMKILLDEQVYDAKDMVARRQTLERELSKSGQAWAGESAKVDALKKARRSLSSQKGKLHAKIKEAERKGLKTETEKRLLAELAKKQEAVEGKLMEEAGRARRSLVDRGLRDPKTIEAELRRVRGSLKDAGKRIKNLKERRDRYIRDWGFKEAGVKRNYVPSIKDSVDATAWRLNAEILSPSVVETLRKSLTSKHQLKRTGALEAAGLAETSPTRILYHYMHRVIPVLHLNDWAYNNHVNLYGRRVRAKWTDVAGGRPKELEYVTQDGQTILVRSRGQYFKMQDGTYLPASSLSKKKRTQLKEQQATLRLAGMGKKGGKLPPRVVLLEHVNVEGSPALKNWHPEDKNWVARNKVLFEEVESHLAKDLLYTRRDGLKQNLEDPAAWDRVEKFVARVFGAAHEMAGKDLDKIHQKMAKSLRNVIGQATVGAMSVSNAVTIFAGGVVFSTATLGARRAALTAGLPFEYYARLRAAKSQGSPLSDLANVKPTKLGEGKAFIHPLAERLRTPKEQLEKMSPARRRFQERLDDAMVDLYTSAIGTSPRHMEYEGFRRTKQTGERINFSMRDIPQLFSSAGWSLISQAEKFIRYHHFLATHMELTAAGKSRKEAQRRAEDAVFAAHGVWVRSMKSPFMQSAWGGLIGAVTNWVQHQAGTSVRMLGGERKTIETFTQKQDRLKGETKRTDASVLKIGARQAQLPISAEGMKTLAKMTFTGAMVTTLAQLFDKDFSRYAGATVRDVPLGVGDHMDALVRGVGIQTEDDPLGLERKPLVRGTVGQVREDAAQWLENFGKAGEVGARFFRALGGDLSEWPADVPIPVLPITVSGPMESLVRYGKQFAEAWAKGDDAKRDDAQARFLDRLTPRLARDIRAAFFSEEDSNAPGTFKVYDWNKTRVLDRVDKEGWEQLFWGFFGPDLRKTSEWVDAGINRKVEKIRKGKAYTANREMAQAMRDYVALEREGGGTPEQREEVANSLLESVGARAEPKYGTRDVNELLKNDQAKADVRRWLKEAQKAAQVWEELDPRERAMVFAFDGKEKVRQLTEAMRSPASRMRKEQVYRMLNIFANVDKPGEARSKFTKWLRTLPEDSLQQLAETFKETGMSFQDAILWTARKGR